MFNFGRFEKLLLGLVIVGLLGAIWAAWLRHGVEVANREVEIIIDGHDLVVLSDAVGRPESAVAARLKRAGATALSAPEISLAELKTRGVAFAQPWGEDHQLLGFTDVHTAERVADALQHKLPGLKIVPAPPGAVGAYKQAHVYYIVKGELSGMNEAGLFLDPEQVSIARTVGLRLVGRIPNSSLAQPKAIAYALALARQAGADFMVFEKEEVLGYDGLVPYTAQEMKRLGMVYGWVELAEQYGEEEMRRELWDEMIRVHGISDKELPKLTREQIMARFLRAARERDIRALYFRPFLRPQPDLLAYNADFITELGRGLAGAGLRPGRAKPYPPLDLPIWALVLMELAGAAGAVLLAGRLLPLHKTGKVALFLLLLVLLGGLEWGAHKALLARQAWALLAGGSLATLGIVLAWQMMATRAEEEERSELSELQPTPRPSQALGTAVALTALVCSFSLVGGLLVGGLLTQTKFMVGAEQFRGVKLLLIGPMFMLAVAMVGGLSRPFACRREWKERISQSLRTFGGQPLLVGEAALLVVVLGAIGVLLMRSGNASSSASPALELQVRRVLEVVLWARPRTKEFLLGHPALLLAAFAWLASRPAVPGLGPRQNRWVGALLLMAAVGQASVADTFCHLHTPIVLSLVRTANGLWLGILIGLAALAVWFIGRRLLLRGAETSPAPVINSKVINR